MKDQLKQTDATNKQVTKRVFREKGRAAEKKQTYINGKKRLSGLSFLIS